MIAAADDGDFDKKKAGGDPAFEFVLLREGRIRFHEIHPTNPLCTNGSVSDVTAVTEPIFFKQFLASAATRNTSLILFDIK